MKIIAHRGNIEGPNPSTENTVEAIEYAIQLGFDVEIDVYVVDDKAYLGHDKPDREVSISFLNNNKTKLWIHAKNIEALVSFTVMKFNTFYHTTEDYVLTRSGYIWAYPGKEVGPFSKKAMIAVLPPKDNINSLTEFKGVCTDYPLDYSDIYYTHLPQTHNVRTIHNRIQREQQALNSHKNE